MAAILTLGVLLAAAAWMLMPPSTPEARLNRYAEDYVELAFGLDRANAGEVDSYFGPANLRESVADAVVDLSAVAERARQLASAVTADTLPGYELRQSDLAARFAHVAAVADRLLAGERPAFADELGTLYGMAVPEGFASEAPEALAELDALLPGRGTLAFRLAAFHNKLIVPPDRRRAVFEAALAECRRRTQEFWSLPAEESLEIEWTRDVSAAWHRYRGGNASTLQINDLTVALVSQAVDLACHEGYPGHHAQFVLMEAAHDEAHGDAVPLEKKLALLRSPGSLLREGAASFGAELAFPPEERLAFERDALFPLAGLPADQAETAWRVHRLVTRLSSAAVPTIRAYYDGEIDFNAASYRLEREAMIMSPVPLLEFVDTYGTYSMGYTLVRDLIRQHAADVPSTAAWEMLQELLTGVPAEGIAWLQREYAVTAR